MSEVSHLKSVGPDIQETVVSALERLLEQAKRGEIRSIVSVSRLQGGGWKEMASGCDDVIEQLGMTQMAVMCLQERLLDR